MALLKTIEELRAVVVMDVTSSIEPVLPILATTERREIVKLLGKEQYEELKTAYDGNTLDENQENLLGLVQAALGNLAYAQHVTVAQLSINDAGIRIVTDENNKSAWQWQIDDLRDMLTEAGHAAVEDLLSFLDANVEHFPKWKASDAYTRNKELLLNNTADFQRCYNINASARTFLALLPILRRVEHFSIEPELSTEFCEALRTEIKAGTALSVATQKVLRLLQPALANLAVAEAVGELSIDLQAGGLVVKELATGGPNNRTKRQAPTDLLAVKRNQALAAGRSYLRDLVAFLNKTATDTVYAAFRSSERYVNPNPPTPADEPTAPAVRRGVYGAC